MKKFSLALSFLLALLACEEKKDAKKPQDASKSGPVSVEAIVIRPTTVSESIEVAGNILPYELTEIRPEISGRVIQLNFKEGSTVAKDVLLDGDEASLALPAGQVHGLVWGALVWSSVFERGFATASELAQFRAQWQEAKARVKLAVLGQVGVPLRVQGYQLV